MYTRITALLIISLFCTGCIPHFLFSTSEKNAREHMKAASAHERADQFEKATAEYQMVQSHYSKTSYYKDAVYQELLLHIDSENPTPDFDAALKLLQTYLTFSLSCQEKQQAKNYQTLLEQIKARGDKEKSILSDLNLLKKEFDACNTKAEDLKDRLEKIKNIDVQMHENKRKRAD